MRAIASGKHYYWAATINGGRAHSNSKEGIIIKNSKQPQNLVHFSLPAISCHFTESENDASAKLLWVLVLLLLTPHLFRANLYKFKHTMYMYLDSVEPITMVEDFFDYFNWMCALS